MCADFNLEYPEFEVVPSWKGSYDETFVASIAAARAGKAPHILHVTQPITREAIDSGIFAVAEDLIDRFGMEVKWEDYIDAVLDTYRVGGRLYCFPWNSSSAILYYNKTLFEKAGVSLSRKPTFEDIIEVGNKIVDGGYATYAITWPILYWWVQQWMAEQGQNVVDNENGRAGRPTKAYLTSDASIQAYEWWKQLYDEGLWVNPGRSAWGEALRIFTSHESAMFISTTAHVTAVQKSSAEGGWELETTFLPIPEGTERCGGTVGGGTLWVTKDHPDEQLKAATKFVVWMSDTAQTIRWHQLTGYYPIKKTAVEILEREGWFEEKPSYRTAIDQLLETKSIPATQSALFGAFRAVEDLMEIAFEEIMGGKPVEEALAKANDKANKAIAEYRRVIGEPIERK